MGPSAIRIPYRHLTARLLTGPAAHLLGGALDLAGAIARHALARVRDGRHLKG